MEMAKHFRATNGQKRNFLERGCKNTLAKWVASSFFDQASLALIENKLVVLCGSMAASALQLAKRALVTLLVAFARSYGLKLALDRDSPDKAVLEFFKKVARKVRS